MGQTPNAKAKADVDTKVFEPQIKRLQERAKIEGEAREKNEQPQWLMPELMEWDGDLFNIEDMAKPFDRTEPNDMFEEATKDATDCGTTGDLIVTTLQVDYLSIMERAFRARHTMRRPRAMAHMLARRKGHGNDRGTLIQANLEFVRNLAKESKALNGE